jgi:hypothetical protein
MNPQNQNEFGPTGHENGVAKQPEVATPAPQTPEAGVRPDDPESKKALIRLNKLRAEGASAEAVTQAENALAEAGKAEQEAAEIAARADLARIHGPIEQPTPYPVHTTEGMDQRPVAVNLDSRPVQAPDSGTSHLYGAQLAEHVDQLVKK